MDAMTVSTPGAEVAAMAALADRVEVADGAPVIGLVAPFDSAATRRTIPTTPGQRALWQADGLGPEASLACNGSTTLRWRGALDTRALILALDQLVARHDCLRASFSPDGLQLVIGDAVPLDLTEIDLSQRDAAAQERLLAEERETALRERFPLETGPLIRAALYRLSAVEHVLLLTAHHAVCDGWSWGVVVDELGRLYAHRTGEGPALPPALPCSAYAAWEAQEAARPVLPVHTDDGLARAAADSLPTLELPLDHHRPTGRSCAFGSVDRLLDHELESALRKLGARSGHSLVATLLAGFAALLHRLTGQQDLAIGVAAAGQLASGMPGLVGHCARLLPIRLAVDAQMPFGSLASQCSTALLDAPARPPLPRDTLAPPVRVLFDMGPSAAPDHAFQGLTMTQGTPQRAFEHVDLALNLTPGPDGLQMQAQYDADLFDDATIRRWLSMYESLLRALVGDATQTVTQLALLSAADMQALLALQPPPTPLIGTALAHAGFAVQAASHPARPALRDGTQRLSYLELDQRANRLARALRARGAQPGQRVGLCLPRGIDMVVGLLAVLKSGAACVPLDPEMPADRLQACAEAAALALLLTDSRVDAAPRVWRADAAGRVLEIDLETACREGSGEPMDADAMDAQPQDPACVIYTGSGLATGSAGKPTGVCLSHRAVANLLQTLQHAPSISADDKLAAIAALSDDIALLELLLPLTAGAEVVLVPREIAADGPALADLLQHSGATMMQATPDVWRSLVERQWQGPAHFRALVRGDGLPTGLAHELVLRCAEVWTLYGPTETTVCSALWHVRTAALANRHTLIGKPIANTTAWIVDAQDQLCAIGVAGEICIGGKGLMLGYLDQPERSAERFVTMRLGGTQVQLFRTGDRGRWRNDGLLERLAGGVPARSVATEGRWPAQPASDTAALPAPDEPAKTREALLLPEQAELAQLWASALDIDVHGIRATDNFFQLGGDAALARRVAQQAQKVLGFQIDPARFAQEELAQLAFAAGAAEASGPRKVATDRPGLLGRLFGPWARKG